jgi:multidrug efflux pump subunit AcrA (membrane-fusion protein)
VAWAGLDKVPATRAEETSALQRRAGDIEVELDAAELRLAEEISRLRSLHEGTRALAAEGESTKEGYVAAQAAVDATRTQIASLSAEQQAVSRALVTPLPPEPVHAHLRHRQLPNQDILRPAHWALRLWAAISVSVLLVAVAALIVLERGSTLNLVIGVAGVVVLAAAIEAALRRRLLPFLAGFVVILLIIAGVYLALTNIKLAVAGALVLAALALLLSNLLGYLRRR